MLLAFKIQEFMNAMMYDRLKSLFEHDRFVATITLIGGHVEQVLNISHYLWFMGYSHMNM